MQKFTSFVLKTSFSDFILHNMETGVYEATCFPELLEITTLLLYFIIDMKGYDYFKSDISNLSSWDQL